MNKTEIFENDLMDNNGNLVGKVAILRGSQSHDNTTQFMDNEVSKYVQNEPIKQFIEIHLDNNYYRLVISGINELNYEVFEINANTKVEIFKQKLNEGKSEITIFRGGELSSNPKIFMDFFVYYEIKYKIHNQFTGIYNDPYYRVIISETDELNYSEFKDQKL